MDKAAEIRNTIDQLNSQGPFEPTMRSLEKYQCPDWYTDGKFGIFIHWGVYCVPAFCNEWYPREMYCEGTNCYEHHLKTYGPHKDFGYKDFIPMFTAEKFDAADWAALFKQAGAKFVVPVAEHHDGFAMYETELNRWNSKEMGPKRDITGEIAEAVKAEGMVFGLSSHRAEHHWFFDGGMRFDSDVKYPEYADLYGPVCGEPHGDSHSFHTGKPTPEFVEDWLVRTCELVDKYQPQLVWFDWWINNIAYKTALKEFAAYLYNRGAEWDKGVALNYKYQAYTPTSAVFDIERGQLDDIYPLFWQNDTSVSKNSWGYIDKHDYKASSAIIADLVDVVSKNGALLLNIGPKADGTIPEQERKMLLEIGQWLKVNGEAIYNTRPWLVYGEGPTKVASGSFSDTKRANFTSGDIRFTRNEDVLYAMPLATPADGVIKIYLLAEKSNYAPDSISKIELLGYGEVEWFQDKDALTVILPEKKASAVPCALKITQ